MKWQYRYDDAGMFFLLGLSGVAVFVFAILLALAMTIDQTYILIKEAYFGKEE